MVTLEQLINYFNDVDGRKYASYVKGIDKLNGHQTVDWIMSVVKKKGTVDDILKLYDSYFATNPCERWDDKTRKNHRTGFKQFSEVILGFFSANVWLSRGRGKTTDLFLCQLIADNAIFASSLVVEKVREGKMGSEGNKKNEYASWDYMAHARINNENGEKVKKDEVVYPLIRERYPDISDSVIVDDNTIANQAIKRAVIASFKERYGGLGTSMYYAFQDYEVCHIWDKPWDRRYYASIANLVLIPRALAALTDHNNMVKNLLRYEAFQRFKFKPEEESEPDFDNKLYSKIEWHRIL